MYYQSLYLPTNAQDSCSFQTVHHIYTNKELINYAATPTNQLQ